MTLHSTAGPLLRAHGRKWTYLSIIIALALELLQPVPLKHHLGRLGPGIQPVDQAGHQGANNQQALHTLLRRVPVWPHERGRDEGRVEVEVGHEQRGGGERGEGKVERGEAGLEGAECGAGESLE